MTYYMHNQAKKTFFYKNIWQSYMIEYNYIHQEPT